MNAKLFDSDPRDFALELVENQIVSADHLLLCCLKYMSTDDVRDMLDANELSPRFDDTTDDEIDIWLDRWDDGSHDIEAMRTDIENGNMEVGDDDRASEYEHLAIVRQSLANGQFTRAKQQCRGYGLDYDQIQREFYRDLV